MVQAVVRILNESPEDIELREDIESMPFDSLVRKYLNKALKHANKTKDMNRTEVARLLSKKTGKAISEHIINRWTRKEGVPINFPLDLLEPFISITGDSRLAQIIPARLGFKVLTPEEKDIWDYYQAVADEEIAKKQRELLEQRLLKRNK